MADENFAKDTFQSFVRKTVLTDFFFTKSGLISLERQFASALWKRMEYKFLHWIFYWNKIYQSNPILIHLTRLTSIYALAMAYGMRGDWWRPGDGKVLHGEAGQRPHVELLRRNRSYM